FTNNSSQVASPDVCERGILRFRSSPAVSSAHHACVLIQEFSALAQPAAAIFFGAPYRAPQFRQRGAVLEHSRSHQASVPEPACGSPLATANPARLRSCQLGNGAALLPLQPY